MWCRRVRSQLSAYMDGELSVAEARNLEQHLAHCESCSLERESLDRLTRITALIPEEDVPVDLHSRIMTRLAYADATPAAAAPARRLTPFGPLVWTAVAGATATVAFAYVQSRGPQVAVRPSPVPPGLAQRAPVQAIPDLRGSGGSQPIHGQEPAGPAEVADAARPQPAAEITGPISCPMTVDAQSAKQPTRATQKPVRLERPVAPSVLALEERPQPLAVITPAGKPVMEARASQPETPATATPPEIVAMPGDPIVNSAGTMQPLGGGPEPVVAMEKDPGMRMAGPGPTEEQIPADDEEGLRALRSFFEERNRTVPQPPALDLLRPRRGRKSL